MGSIKKTGDRRRETDNRSSMVWLFFIIRLGLPRTFFISCLILIFFSCGDSKFPYSAKDSRKTVILPGGKVNMFGRNDFEMNIPELEVSVYEVTNASFAEFVKATGYVTTAERRGAGMVFDPLKGWVLTRWADWDNPRGTGSTIYKKDMDPVVQVSYEDACAYCDWLDMRLPYESEWEYIYQSDQKGSGEKFNKWDGIFPIEDKGKDGFTGTAPVGSYEPGSKGIYDLRGNVWEWCNDVFHANWPELDTTIVDPAYEGPNNELGCVMYIDTLRVTKGGSFLCAENYCKGYSDNKRQSADPKLSYEHIGFRCVREGTFKKGIKSKEITSPAL